MSVLWLALLESIAGIDLMHVGILLLPVVIVVHQLQHNMHEDFVKLVLLIARLEINWQVSVLNN